MLLQEVFAGKPLSFLKLNTDNHIISIPLAEFMLSPDGQIEKLNIPLKRAGNLLLIDAYIDQLPGNLIFDTGSARFVLNAMYFRYAGRNTRQGTGGITGEVGSVGLTVVGELNIATIRLKNLEADVTDLGHIEKARNTKILGLFGLNLFEGYELVLDLQNNQLELYKAEKSSISTSKLLDNEPFDLEVNYRQHNGQVFIEGFIAGRRCTFCLDTGAESNVLSNELPTKVMNTLNVLRRIKLRGAGQQSTEALYCQMTDFSINEMRFNGMNALVTDLSAMNEVFGVHIDGMLGCDFLDHGVFHFNTSDHKIKIVLNEKHYEK